ncbi:MAG: hypothetical protein NVSMB52_13770 [Chloroflexota bacterium]
MLRKVLVALVIGVGAPILPSSTHAGGGVGGGGAVFTHGIAIQVDGSVPGRKYNFDAFYPRNAVVRQGGTVTWTFAPNQRAQHNIAICKGGTTPPRRRRPQPQNVCGDLAAALPQSFVLPDRGDHGAPPLLPFNVLQPYACGASSYFPASAPCTFDGRTTINSGFMTNGDNPGTGKVTPGAVGRARFSATFTATPGSYHYFCLFHGDMSGSIRVVPATASIPSQADIARVGNAQFQRDVRAVQNLEAGAMRQPAGQSVGGHTSWTVHAGLSMTVPNVKILEVTRMIPEHIDIKPGDTVVWQVANGGHTVTLPADTGIYPLTPLCEAKGHDSPIGWNLARCTGRVELSANRADIPTGKSGQPYTGGFSNSAPQEASHSVWSLSFPKSGSFRYDCLLHTGMDGSIGVH